MPISRGKNGKLGVNSLDLQIALDDMFMLAKTEEELDWIEEVLTGHVEMAKEEAESYLEKEESDD